MKPILAALVLACLMATGAAAQSCGPTDHTLRAEVSGFLPKVMYLCSGQNVYVENRSGKDWKLKYTNASGVVTYTNTISNTVRFGPITNAGNGTITATIQTTSSYQERYRCGWFYCYRTVTETVDSNAFPNGSTGTFTIGMAPVIY